MADQFPALTESDIRRPQAREEFPALTEQDVRRSQLPPQPVGRPSPKGTPEDTLKAMAAQGVLGVTADVPGAPGDIAALAQRFLPEPFAGYAGKVPLPTSETLEKLETQYFPSLGYKGVSPEARERAAATRLGTSMAVGPGGLAGAAGRFAVGYGASELGQGAREAFTDTGFIGPEYREYVEPAVTTAATIAGMAGAPTVAKVLRPSGSAQRSIADAIKQDVASGLIDPENLRSGRVSPADLAVEGSALRNLIEAQGGVTKDTQAALDAYRGSLSPVAGTRIKGRYDEAFAHTNQLLENINRGPIAVGELEDYLRDTGKHVRDDIYSLARTSPQAGNIDFTSLGTYKTADGLSQPLAKNPHILTSIYDVTKNADKYDPSYGIMPPKPVTLANGTQITSPGNIAFWDMVKRDLDQKSRNLYATGSDQNVQIANGMKTARNELVDRLDQIVPGYEIARNKAAETFGTESAPAAGMMFYKKMDEFDNHQARAAFSQMTPEQRNLFKTGWLANLRNDLSQKNGFNGVADKLYLPGQFSENARIVLGPEFDRVRGSIISGNIRMNAKPFSAQPSESFLFSAGKLGGMTGAALAVGEALTEAAIQTSMLPGKLGTAVGAGALVGAGVTGVRKIADRRLANTLIPMVMSDDPRMMVRLSKMIDQNPRIGEILSRTNQILQSTQQPRISPVVEQEQVRESGQGAPPIPDFGGRATRATGGRVMTAERMMSMAKRAKKEIENQTKALLDEPDEHIVKALKVANEHI